MASPPPPALQYQGLSAGPGWIRTYEIQPGVPFDGSKALLRDPVFGSPFTFGILPPPVLMDALANTIQTEPIGIVNAAMRTNDAFSDYTRQIDEFRSTNFVTKSNAQQTRLTNLVGNNGVMFNAATGATSQANVLGIADVAQALSVIAQLNAMLATPPLTLLVNPVSMQVTRQKKQQYQDRTRFGYLFQAWGEEQVRLSVSGMIGGFIAGTRFTDSDSPQNFIGAGGPERGRIVETTAVSGLQFASKRDSASFQNLMSLLTIYRNNGYIHDVIGQTEAHWWHGMIAISYDQWSYLGHFENLSYTYSETKQNGGLDFNFDFVCSAVIDNSQRTAAVLPIRAPTASPSDPLWSSTNNVVPTPTSLRGRMQSAGNLNPPQTTILDPARAAILRAVG